MMVLVTGGSKSGKSTYGENLITEMRAQVSPKLEPKIYYIATMEPFGSEDFQVIKRHRIAREGKGFITIEKFRNIHEVEVEADSMVLLECVGNLVANEMFSMESTEELTGKTSSEECRQNVIDRVISGIKKLKDSCSELVVITNQVCSDTGNYPEETREYIRQMGLVNQELSRIAERVVETVYGIPIEIKK